MIKNKDGSEYIYSQPNPLITNQNLLYFDEFINFDKFEEFTINYNKVIKKERKGIKTKLFCHRRENDIYTDKFSFDGYYLASNDLFIKIWTDQEISLQSVLLVTEQRRWWKVSEVEKAEDGFILTAMPSDLKPTFS